MDVAHFNPAVNLVAYSKPQSSNDINLHPAYPDMTAIDFAGHNDTDWTIGRAGGAPAGVDLFYRPLLDENGLTSIINRDETNNLLVYAPAADGNAQTYGVLTAYFTEPAYSGYYDSSDPYRRVSAAPYWTVFGHLVQSNLKATSDQLLVDKQDFNCPISYQFVDDKRMWHQRLPDLFVDQTKGWEGISLPFTAELVSTQDKGEITHFYSGSRTIEGSGAKIGHEYWLREYKGQKENTNPQTDGFFTAAFNYPDAAGDDTKTVGNTFLWDYYYSKNEQKDANTDTYQTYYKQSRSNDAYPLLATAKPYIIGFPGKTYYEFDLSGEWTAKNTATTAPAQLSKQSISFVSVPNITIRVSDDELHAVTADNYSFMPNYMSKKEEGFLMNATGSSFDVTPTGGSATVPFRPYFVASPAPAPSYDVTRSIHFDSSESSFTIDEDPSDELTGELRFSVKPRKLVTSSTLRKPADVQIYSTSGVVISSFTIQPGETVETDINTSGVYIVRAANGRYTKKLTLK
jgi:hypothetical protein